MIQIIKSDENLDTSQIEYQPLEQYGDRIKSVNVRYKHKKLILQSPEIEVLPKIYRFSNCGTDKDGFTKYYLLVKIDKDTKEPVVEKFHRTLTSIDNQFLQDGLCHGNEWFDGYKTLGQLERIYSPNIQTPNNNFPFPELVYNGLKYLKIRIPVNTRKEIGCQVFNVHNTRLKLDISTMENIIRCRNNRVHLLIKCDGLWFAGGKYGASWKLSNLRFPFTIPKTVRVNNNQQLDNSSVKNTINSNVKHKKRVDFETYCFMSDSD